jgi:CHAD domain-containing protein
VSPAPAERRAGDFLTPVLFTLISAVRQAAVRVSSSSDPQAIHDFRVALRRLRTVLRPARRLYGKRSLREIGGELRRFAQATGALRDEEVLRETLAALELPARAQRDLAAWLVQRARQERARRRRVSSMMGALPPNPRAEGSLIARAAPITGPPLAEALAHLERRLGDRRGAPRSSDGAPSSGPPSAPWSSTTAGALAEAALAEATAGVEEHLGAHASDAVALHTLRIRYKRLRYTAELFAPILGERAAPIARAAARMQKRLGELHDLDEALARVARARGLSHAARAAVRRALVETREGKRDRIRRDLAEEQLRLRPAPAPSCSQGPPRP